MSTFIAAATSVALILSGGGGRGAYQIGVWKALNELRIEIDAVYGTSVGAINGAMISIGDYEFAEKSWLELTFGDIMNIPESVKKLISGKFADLSIPEAIDATRKLISEKGIDISPLREKLKALLPEEKIRNSKVHYGLVAYSVSELKPYMLYIEEIPDGMLADYILSSANFPLFKREEIGGKLFIDGGVYSNIPLKMAIDKGYENIIVVDIGTVGVADILEYIRIFMDRGKIEYIRPREHFATVLTFNPEISRKYLLEGYL
ncbi:MAG TPA: patatin, partial [Pseudothermotoga sp.]|nr:patatin [Pseudothermotoga sp.]